MEFEKWSADVIKHMAVVFAKCTDEEQIAEILRLYHQLWSEEASRRVAQSSKTMQLVRMVNNLSA